MKRSLLNKVSPLYLVTFSPLVIATELDHLFTYDLEDLLEIEISVATKSEQNIALSPSSVTVFNRQQLNQLNIHQLADLADITPGYSSYHIFGERVFETRGQKAGSFENNKHLVLLDGIPLNHARANKAPIENELPLSSVKQVEMLSGPASSLYGVGAFFGVVNLTSNLHTENQAQVNLRYEAEYQGKQINAHGNYHSTLGHSYMAFSAFSKEANKQQVGPDFSPLQKYYDDQDADFIYLRHQLTGEWLTGLNFGYIKLNRESGLGEHWTGDFSTEQNHIEWDTEIQFIQLPITLTDTLQLNTQFVLNQSTETGFATPFTRDAYLQAPQQAIPFQGYKVDVESKQIQSELNWQINRQSHLLIGAAYEEKIDQGGYLDNRFMNDVNLQAALTYQNREESEKVKYTGYYAQYYQHLVNWWDLHLTAGLRYDQGEYLSDEFSHTSPRVALVKAFSEQLSMKASFGSALRSPGLKEYLLNSESIDTINQTAADVDQALSSIPVSLAAETFDSIELSISYNSDNFTSKYSLFHNTTEQALNGRPVSYLDIEGKLNSLNSFYNSGHEIKIWGYEASSTWFIDPAWQASGFFSQVFDHEGSQESMIDTPKQKLHLRISHHFEQGSAFISQHFRRYQTNAVSTLVQTDVGFDYPLSNQIYSQLKIQNLFDHQDYLPQNGLKGNPLPERQLSLSITMAL